MHKDSLFDAVRFGISMYGLSPSAHVSNELPFPLGQAMTLHTEVVHREKSSSRHNDQLWSYLHGR